MKPIDHLDYLDSFMVELVVLSTYNFDPVFFERRVLRTKALDRARRIAVLVDAGKWDNASRSDLPICWANCRYLVVPVSRRPGVFHPKIGLFLSETEAVIACGSGNLTRPGMTHNLEILNLLHAHCKEGMWSGPAAVAAQTVQFFGELIADARYKEAQILQEWLKECWSYGLPEAHTNSDGAMLLHTCGADLWQPVSKAIDDAEPEEISILSPFFDRDLSLLRRVRERWPRAQVSIIAQSQSSNLDAELAHRIAPHAQICSLTKGSRRLHAKLLAWEGRWSSGYLVGSANFTTAAFLGRNVEACLLVRQSANFDAALFHGAFKPTPISPSDFVAGLTSEPVRDQRIHTEPLKIKEAIINDDEGLSISYSIADPQRWETISFGLRGLRDADPSFSRQVPNRPVGSMKVDLSESAFTSRGAAIRCSLIGVSETERVESRTAWVVQETRLTHERGASRLSRIHKWIWESGSGLVEQMTEIGFQEGFGGVIDFLDQVNIRYYDGGGRAPGGRALSIRISDPWDSGKVPRWLSDESVSAEEFKRLGKAICDYADRHEKTRLRRHAKKGNINGIENFCDVLASVAQVLLTGFCHWRQGDQPAVPRNQIIGRLCRYIDLATAGCDDPRHSSPGYLATLMDNTKGDRTLLAARCKASGIGGLLVALLRTAQILRLLAGDVRENSDATRLLPESTRTLQESFTQCGLAWPPEEQVKERWRVLRRDSAPSARQSLGGPSNV